MPAATARRHAREAGILAALAAGPATVRQIAAIDAYAHLNGVCRGQKARLDLDELIGRGVVVRDRPAGRPGRDWSPFPYMYRLSGGPMTMESRPDPPPEPTWSLEELLCWLAQGEGCPPERFEACRAKAVAAVRDAIDARDGRSKGNV